MADTTTKYADHHVGILAIWFVPNKTVIFKRAIKLIKYLLPNIFSQKYILVLTEQAIRSNYF